MWSLAVLSVTWPVDGCDRLKSSSGQPGTPEQAGLSGKTLTSHREACADCEHPQANCQVSWGQDALASVWVSMQVSVHLT